MPNDFGEKVFRGDNVGGWGSGSYIRLDEKTRVESCTSLSVKELQRDKILSKELSVVISWGNNNIGLKSYGDYIQFAYGSKERKYDYCMGLDKTPCNYGGYRYWFICNCGKRTSKLYLRNYYFRCRCCHDLTYRSQQESGNRLDEHTRRAEQIRKKLGCSERGFIDVPTPDKPKGMHWKTYQDLRMKLWIEEGRAKQAYYAVCGAIMLKG